MFSFTKGKIGESGNNTLEKKGFNGSKESRMNGVNTHAASLTPNTKHCGNPMNALMLKSVSLDKQDTDTV